MIVYIILIIKYNYINSLQFDHMRLDTLIRIERNILTYMYVVFSILKSNYEYGRARGVRPDTIALLYYAVRNELKVPFYQQKFNNLVFNS